MANAREIRLRIKSVKETQKITKAMKLISAAKLRRSRQQLEQTLPFFKKVQETMADIIAHTQSFEEIKFFKQKEEGSQKKTLYILITGDKGLAGGYNSNVIKLTERTIVDKEDSVLLTAGFMGHNYFSKKGYNIKNEEVFPSQNPSVYRAREITDIVIEDYLNNVIDEVYVIYTHMVSSLNLQPKVLRLLPLEAENFKGINIETRKNNQFLYEPSPAAVFNTLVPQYIKGLLYGALVESFTSELSARMTAMDSATGNADKMIQKFTLFYNRARQAAITQEISEIVGGAAALK